MLLDPTYLLLVLLTTVHAAPLNATVAGGDFRDLAAEKSMSLLERRGNFINVLITGEFGGPKLRESYLYGSHSNLGGSKPPLPNAVMERTDEALVAKWSIPQVGGIAFVNAWKGTTRDEGKKFSCKYWGVATCTREEPCYLEVE
ncbi:hypothetical protein J3R30DRAFT_1134804 [Lentinula aciculospora]|uniref:Uncharacterized protein n=1 Tax=Lentinula aciculospora TaxID=153920 RepID=A0A9W8ZZQ8_9AGAR|nr:hypothetical protein J3R30DRAFT_1134804 [Lentinula aciculospora]